jgi:hypothetical protein
MNPDISGQIGPGKALAVAVHPKRLGSAASSAFATLGLSTAATQGDYEKEKVLDLPFGPGYFLCICPARHDP